LAARAALVGCAPVAGACVERGSATSHPHARNGPAQRGDGSGRHGLELPHRAWVRAAPPPSVIARCAWPRPSACPVASECSHGVPARGPMWISRCQACPPALNRNAMSVIARGASASVQSKRRPNTRGAAGQIGRKRRVFRRPRPVGAAKTPSVQSKRGTSVNWRAVLRDIPLPRPSLLVCLCWTTVCCTCRGGRPLHARAVSALPSPAARRLSGAGSWSMELHLGLRTAVGEQRRGRDDRSGYR